MIGPKHMETSKLLLLCTGIIFVFSLIAAVILSWNGKDTSAFMYIIPSTGGVFGAAIVFYLNKAKMENVFKGKVSFLKLKLDLLKDSTPKQKEIIGSELQAVETALDSKVDSELNEAVGKDMDITNY